MSDLSLYEQTKLTYKLINSESISVGKKGPNTIYIEEFDDGSKFEITFIPTGNGNEHRQVVRKL